MTDTRITHEIEANPPAATLSEDDGRWTLTLQRRLRHDPARVWRMLTVPEELARWSSFVPDRTLDTVGPATARENPDDEPVAADVLVLDPPRELVHRWGDDLLRPWAGSFAAGWHIVLATLAALEGSDEAPRVVGQDAMEYGWERLRDEYDGLLPAR